MSGKGVSALRIPNFFYGFSFDGILMAFASGALISIGQRILKSHHKLLTGEDNNDIYQAGKGGALFAFGIYCWIPPLVRKYYLVIPGDIGNSIGLSGTANSLINLTVSGAGMAFAGLTGMILGYGYGHLVCDDTNDKDDLSKRITQCSKGFATLLSGIYLASPNILKAMWIAAYFGVDDT